MEHARFFAHAAPVHTPTGLTFQPSPQQRYQAAALANTRAALCLALGLARGLPADMPEASSRWSNDLCVVLFALDHMLTRQHLLEIPPGNTETAVTPCHAAARLPETVTALRMAVGSLNHAIAMTNIIGDVVTAECLKVIAHMLGNVATMYQFLLDTQPEPADPYVETLETLETLETKDWAAYAF